MKKLMLSLVALSVIAACDNEQKSSIQRKVDEYKTVRIAAPDLSGISDNGKEVLNLYRFAADQADSIYWKQAFGDKSEMTALTDEATRTFAMINYGPWDRITGETFVNGYGARPAGLNFYPADMTAEEFEAFDDPDKSSPFTLLRRNAEGGLETVWYHDAYKENINKICSYLKAAADITIRESVRNYLLKKIDALRSDNYYDCDLAWLDMEDSKMDLILGPDEVSDDQLLGLKASYEAFVLLKDEKQTENLKKIITHLPEFQASLPCADEYKTFAPGAESRIHACTALYYAGQANAGIKVIALNLPFNSKVQEEKGTKTILLENIINEKFNRIVFPAGLALLNDSHALNRSAFFSNIACREIAHGLGVKETVNGKGSVASALGNEAAEFEEMKANMVGLFISYNLVKKHQSIGLTTPEDVLATYLANLLRSERFGEGEPLGRANIMIYNYLSKKDAFRRTPAGKYDIDYAIFYDAVTELSGRILEIQATGDYESAKAFSAEYGSVPETLKEDVRTLKLEGVPTDLRFEFEF